MFPTSAVRAPTIAIGNVIVPNPVVLAPMSGVTDAPFRRMTARLGAGLVVSEMTASEDLVQARPNAVLRTETQGLVLLEAMAQGALSDFGAFDAHLQRQSDLLREHAPEAIRPVFEYLASDPRDGEVEGRFKNAIEGLGLGVAAHGVLSAVRVKPE